MSVLDWIILGLLTLLILGPAIFLATRKVVHNPKTGKVTADLGIAKIERDIATGEVELDGPRTRIAVTPKTKTIVIQTPIGNVVAVGTTTTRIPSKKTQETPATK